MKPSIEAFERQTEYEAKGKTYSVRRGLLTARIEEICMVKKSLFGVPALMVGVVLALSLVGCGGDGDSSRPGGNGPTGGK